MSYPPVVDVGNPFARPRPVTVASWLLYAAGGLLVVNSVIGSLSLRRLTTASFTGGVAFSAAVAVVVGAEVVALVFMGYYVGCGSRGWRTAALVICGLSAGGYLVNQLLTLLMAVSGRPLPRTALTNSPGYHVAQVFTGVQAGLFLVVFILLLTGASKAYFDSVARPPFVQRL